MVKAGYPAWLVRGDSIHRSSIPRTHPAEWHPVRDSPVEETCMARPQRRKPGTGRIVAAHGARPAPMGPEET